MNNIKINFLPVRPNSKAPSVNWAQYQKEYYNGAIGDRRGVVCGAISGGLECLDFDSAGVAFEPWTALVDESVLKACYIERTPSGGYHVFYRRADAVPGNEKLALTRKDDKDVVLIETRGEGGFAVCAPTDGYKALSGDLEKLAPLSTIDVEILKRSARALNEIAPTLPKKENKTTSEPRPADDWETAFRSSGELRELIENALTSAGWTKRQNDNNGGSYWAHPDCKDGGWHIHLFEQGDVYAFSYGAKSLPFNKEVYGALEALSILTGSDFATIKKDYFKRHPENNTPLKTSFVLVPEKSEKENAEPQADRPSLDPDAIVKRLPSMFQEAYKRAVRSQVKTQKGFALWTLLASVGVACGRRVAQLDEFADLVPVDTNLSGVVLGGSGAGKNTVKKIAQKVLDCDALRLLPYSDLLSGQALAERLFEERRLLTIFDEAQDTIFKAGGNNNGGLRTELKKAVSDVEIYALPQGIASRGRVQEIAKINGYCDTTRVYNPSVTALFMGVPALVQEGISDEDINGGFAGRLFYCLEDKDVNIKFTPNASGRLDFSGTAFGDLIYKLSSIGAQGVVNKPGEPLTLDDVNIETMDQNHPHEPERSNLENCLLGVYPQESFDYLTDSIKWLETIAPTMKQYSPVRPVLTRQRELLVKLAFILSVVENVDFENRTFQVTLNACKIAFDLVKSSLEVLVWLLQSRSSYDGETMESKGRNKVYTNVKKWLVKNNVETITPTALVKGIGGQIKHNPELRSWVITNLLNEGVFEVDASSDKTRGRKGDRYNVKQDVLSLLV